ncbi:transglutaminase domain-containing protein [Demequina sp. NBRC 110051]|uniref:transglutaminase domain-containing protein n=1 Tax=Demequina sp. NBRC 110051 TaxID=1570340 RepID=UPI001F366C7B|nr:transglutaminase domain-containing protein [Demequina sp. NBRC 110051]
MVAYSWVQPYLPAWANVGAQVAALTTPDAPEVAYPTYGSVELVTYLEAHLIAQTDSIDVTRWTTREGFDSVEDAITEALIQNPYVYANGGQWRDTGARVKYEPFYRYSEGDAEHRRAVTRQAIEQGLLDSGAATAATAAEKVTAIHDYIVAIADYDYTAYDLITAGAIDGARVDQSQEAYGIFAAGTAVCNGYAQAFLAMAEAAGLDAVQVTGTVSSGMTVGNHAWNKVLVDGRWLVVDTTWDDPLPGEAPQREYLMIPSNSPLLVTRVEDADWVVDTNIGAFA